MDFYILFLPRSGSHMLVSALNSHPEISCEHRDRDIEPSDGRIKGTTVVELKDPSKKVIYLTRNKSDRLKSLAKLGLKERGVTEEMVKAQRDSLQDHIEISYEDITGNSNIEHIPEEYSNMICDYLGVERHLLTTSYTKLPQ